jgi:hypothetical protein
MFHYLASPYRAFPGGLDAAYDLAVAAAAELIDRGLEVYSPIAHSHHIARNVRAAGANSDFWLERHKPFLSAACGLLVLKAPGWDRSSGIRFEIAFTERAGKPVRHLGFPEINLPEDLACT